MALRDGVPIRFAVDPTASTPLNVRQGDFNLSWTTFRPRSRAYRSGASRAGDSTRPLRFSLQYCQRMPARNHVTDGDSILIVLGFFLNWSVESWMNAGMLIRL